MSHNASENKIFANKIVAEHLKTTDWISGGLTTAMQNRAYSVSARWRVRTADIDGWIADQSKKTESLD